VLNALDRYGSPQHDRDQHTDHGISFPLMKCNLEDNGWACRLSARTGWFQGGKVCDALISHLDIFRHLRTGGSGAAAVAGGRSILPVVRAKPRKSMNGFRRGQLPRRLRTKRAVRTRRWKYIRASAIPYARAAELR